MAGTPQLNSKEITGPVEQLWALAMKDSPIPEMDWRRALRAVEQARTTPLAEIAIRLEAVLWAIRYNPTNVEKALASYAGRFGKSMGWYLIRASIGPMIARHDMVTDLLERNEILGSREMLVVALNASVQIGHFITARNILINLEKLGVTDEEHLSTDSQVDIPGIINAAVYLQQHAISETELSKRIEVAAKVVMKHARPAQFTTYAGEFGIMFDYALDKPFDDLFNIGLEISEALCLAFEDTMSEHISISVTPLIRDEH